MQKTIAARINKNFSTKQSPENALLCNLTVNNGIVYGFTHAVTTGFQTVVKFKDWNKVDCRRAVSILK